MSSGLAECKDGAYRKNTLSEDNDVHVQWFQVCRTIRVLLETAETDEIVRPEQLNLFASLLH